MRPTRTAALTAALLIAAGVTAGQVYAQPSEEPAPPADPSAEAAPPPAPKTNIDTDGTFVVGQDIVPGTYASAGPVPDGACYWKRTSGDELIDNAMSKKPQVVQILASDTSFTTNDCQPWQLTNQPVPPAGNPMDVLGQLGKLVLTGPSGPTAGGSASAVPAQPAPSQSAPTGPKPGP
jgi:hypothetical protein